MTISADAAVMTFLIGIGIIVIAITAFVFIADYFKKYSKTKHA